MSKPARPRILVTRSEPGASETATRLEAAGFEAVVEPMFSIVAFNATLPDFDALAFTSANGVRRFAALSPRRDAAVFCVGARTAMVAREAGFADVTSAAGDVAVLGDLIAERLTLGARLLHAGNEDTRGDLAGRLSSSGIVASFVALFRAEPVATPGPALSCHLAGEPAFAAVLVHSPRGGDILAGMIRASTGPAPIDVAAISAAAAAPLEGLTRRIALAEAPNETSLISALAGLVSG